MASCLPAQIVVDGSKLFSFPGCSLLGIVSSTTPGSGSLVHGFTHDESVPCLFSTCLGFFFDGSWKDIVRVSISTPKNLSFTLVQYYILHWRTT